MAEKTRSATGQQVRAEQPDQAEQKLPAGQQGGERTRSGRTFGHEWTYILPTETRLLAECQVLGRTA